MIISEKGKIKGVLNFMIIICQTINLNKWIVVFHVRYLIMSYWKFSEQTQL